ncbi:uncharacterized protein PFL1_03974 [Pseudozyma flocculosa PF-1]|uniref:Uncharacterized protein n=2 Tax=Pseudozyma flocculosa TaxID=84751 RepID=A0A5C3EWJ9_9BASI|nr:uncharacterized protein PFL1_03974 [Pseudozyma flocculosa PF-1]EPQ28671.1 hypothetical protein PFL1_03974 [Pseudozyma flocculosa PF-1]SPO36623.1 uncharacterized protein PSFLO_02094 [Pseudozyma flocculosa]
MTMAAAEQSAATPPTPTSAGLSARPHHIDLSSLRNGAGPIPLHAGGVEKHVEFDGVCMVIPNVDHKQLRKLLRLYASGREQHVGQGAGNGDKDGAEPAAALRPAASKPSRPRYGMRLVSVPLSPGQWGGGNIRSSLANLNLGSKVDLTAVASGLAPASISVGGTPSHRASSSSTSVNELSEPERPELDEGRYRRARSLSDDDRCLRTRQRSTSPSDQGHAEGKGHPVEASSPRVLRMKVPTFGGWRRSAPLAEPPQKGCLLKRKKPVIGPTAAAATQQAATPSPVLEGSEGNMRKRFEGPPVRASAPEGCASFASALPTAPPARSPGPGALLRRAGSLGRRPSARRKGSELSEVEAGDGFAAGTAETSVSDAFPAQLDDASVKRELKLGRWPFQEPLNPECNCKDCAESISLVNVQGYRPHWSRSARAKWLADRKEREAREQLVTGLSAPATPRSGAAAARPSSRGRIQADEMDIKMGTGSRPQTPEEEEEEGEAESEAEPEAEPEAGTEAGEQGEGTQQVPKEADLAPGDESRPKDVPNAVDPAQMDATAAEWEAVKPTAVAPVDSSVDGPAHKPAEASAGHPYPSPATVKPSGTLLVAPIAKPAIPIFDEEDDDYLEGDEELAKEIDSRRTSIESRNSYRPGARSMMRQLDEADQIERQASVERERRRNSASPSVAGVAGLSPRSSPSPRPGAMHPRSSPSPRPGAMNPRSSPSPRPGSINPYFDIPRRGSPLALGRPTLGPISEGSVRSKEQPTRPRVSPLRGETGETTAEEDEARRRQLARADQLPLTPGSDAKGGSAAATLAPAAGSKSNGTVKRKVSRSFFGLLGSPFGGSSAPPG